MPKLAQIVLRDRLMNSKGLGLVIRAPVSAKENVHEWRKVRVVPCITRFVVMPVMQLRCSDQHAQRANWQPHIRVNEDGPKPPEGQKARQSLLRSLDP